MSAKRLPSGQERCLMYCIAEGEPSHRHPLPAGVDGMLVRLVAYKELLSAVSPIGGVPRPEAAQVLTYQRVVSVLHQERTVLPLRYGCILDGDDEVVALLADRYDTWTAALRELRGCVEIGVRVLLASGSGRRAGASARPMSTAGGRDYLLACNAYYADIDRTEGDEALLLEKVCTTFSGLYVDLRVDSASPAHCPDARMLSLCFLVPREHEISFWAACRRVETRLGAAKRLLSSGPWPPYSFVPNMEGATDERDRRQPEL